MSSSCSPDGFPVLPLLDPKTHHHSYPHRLRFIVGVGSKHQGLVAVWLEGTCRAFHYNIHTATAAMWLAAIRNHVMKFMSWHNCGKNNVLKRICMNIYLGMHLAACTAGMVTITLKIKNKNIMRGHLPCGHVSTLWVVLSLRLNVCISQQTTLLKRTHLLKDEPSICSPSQEPIRFHVVLSCLIISSGEMKLFKN